MLFWLARTWAQLREFLQLQRDPLLVDLRARLLKRRLEVLVPPTLLLVAVQIWHRGWGFWALLFPATLVIWYWSRQSRLPAWVGPFLTLLFVFACAKISLDEDPDRLSFAVIVMALVPIFGVFTVGLGHGLLLFAISTLVGWQLYLRAPPGNITGLLATVCLANGFWYFGAAIAQMGLYMLLIKRLRLSHVNTARADAAVKDLNAVLGDIGRKGVEDLRTRLEKGLPESHELQPLAEELAATRAWLPQSLPKGIQPGPALADSFKYSAYKLFLTLLLISAAVLTVQLFVRNELWPLSAIGVFVLLLTLTVQKYLTRWQQGWNFLLLSYFALVFADVLVFRGKPPPFSVFFLPLIVYISSFLEMRRQSLTALILGCAFLLLSLWTHKPLPGYPWIAIALGICSFIVWRASDHSVKEQRGLLDGLAVEEAALQASLVKYRRLVSSLFHDLANPLSVLQALAQLPPSLRQAEDQDRAWRMVNRMEEVLKQGGSEAPRFRPATAADLYHDLWDAYAEALRKKKQQWTLGAGAALGIKKAGPLLKDGILSQLLSNAIRFSPQGSTIEFSAEVRAGGLSLFLRDRGPGLAPVVLEELAHNRMPPVQADDQGERGLGLGLLLAQERAHSLGGKLRFRNPPGGGLETEVWLPA